MQVHVGISEWGEFRSRQGLESSKGRIFDESVLGRSRRRHPHLAELYTEMEL
jgi:hypothetical protein